MEHNPYAPTKAALTDAPPGAGDGSADELAPRWRRFVNVVIDGMGYLLLSMVVGAVIGLTDASLLTDLSKAGEYAFGFGIMFLYYLPSEALFGRTLGKLVTRTRVVSESGEFPTFWQLLRRTLYRFVPFDAFSFFSTQRPGWHDRWSETRVVLTRND